MPIFTHIHTHKHNLSSKLNIRDTSQDILIGSHVLPSNQFYPLLIPIKIIPKTIKSIQITITHKNTFWPAEVRMPTYDYGASIHQSPFKTMTWRIQMKFIPITMIMTIIMKITKMTRMNLKRVKHACTYIHSTPILPYPLHSKHCSLDTKNLSLVYPGAHLHHHPCNPFQTSPPPSFHQYRNKMQPLQVLAWIEPSLYGNAAHLIPPIITIQIIISNKMKRKIFGYPLQESDVLEEYLEDPSVLIYLDLLTYNSLPMVIISWHMDTVVRSTFGHPPFQILP
mmetsp:Transcript_21750/g.30516  ORF Transcript_21750/g.30516 Transcript_21750/m.30516 type:complete len:281 (-) Transcript_21750:29-871(-)